VNVLDAPDRWLRLGSPVLPALVVEGVPRPVRHPSQVASLLGLPGVSVADPVRVGRDLERLLAAWLEALAAVPWEAVMEETPSRGRTPLELAVNTFVPVALLPPALASRRFEWPGNPETGAWGDAPLREYELALEAAITGHAELAAFADPVVAAWARFLDEHEASLQAEAERELETPAGPAAFALVLEGQRLHAAQHYRQVTTHFRARGRRVPAFDLSGLDLPERIY
jgi:hypothetical protein